MRAAFAVSLVSVVLAIACSSGDGGSGAAGDARVPVGGGPSTGGVADGGAAGGGSLVPPETGCADDDGCAPGNRCDRAAAACRPACAADAECGPTARCAVDAGVCRALPPCDASTPCAAGSTCTCRGVCEPVEGTPCMGDLQCPVEEFCDLCVDACRPRIAPCARCDEATGGCERRTDRCLPVGAAGLAHCLRGCIDQSTCDALGAGYLCRQVGDDSVCVPPGAECGLETGCASDTDCPRGRICGERGVCQPGCEADVACPVGQVCEASRCRPPCAGPADCPNGGMCEADGHCRVPGGCITSADCPERETHCDRAEGRCVPGCELDADCLSAADVCVDGACVSRGCTGNYQCAFEEVCALETGRCEPAGGRHCESGCDPMDTASCGPGNRCLSLQDEDGNALGDFCYEACQESPNECPQGYQCQSLELMMNEPPVELCVRRCDREPIQ